MQAWLAVQNLLPQPLASNGLARAKEMNFYQRESVGATNLVARRSAKTF